MTPEEVLGEFEAAYRRVEHRMTHIERVAFSSALGAFYNLTKEHAEALKLLSNTPPDLTSAREEADTLRREIERMQVLLWNADGMSDERDAAVKALRDQTDELLFWKSAAERALRLWGQVQDELDKRDEAIQRWYYWSNNVVDIVESDTSADENDIDEMRGQVDNFVEQSGFDITEHT